MLVLSITAVLTAWCGFEASKWGGEMSIAFSQASSARIQAATAAGEARSATQYDLSLYIEWVRAEFAGDAELAEYVEARFPPHLRVAFDAWTDGGRQAHGPFAIAEYVPPGTDEAAELNKHADTRFQDALTYNQRGDNYSLLTVLFALVLFLTALSQRDITRWARHAFLGLAIAVGVACAVIVFTFPIKI